jgi:hypothetical protein
VQCHKRVGVSIDIESLIDFGDVYISIGDCIVGLEISKFLCCQLKVLLYVCCLGL